MCVGYESTYIIVSGAEWSLKIHFTILSLSVTFKEKEKEKEKDNKKTTKNRPPPPPQKKKEEKKEKKKKRESHFQYVEKSFSSRDLCHVCDKKQYTKLPFRRLFVLFFSRYFTKGKAS